MARVLIACEYSGIVRDAFKNAGDHAVSCDFLPTDSPGIHYRGDVSFLLDGWEPVVYSTECMTDDESSLCQKTDLDCGECQCIGPTMSQVEYTTDNDGNLLGRPVDHPHWDLMIGHPPCTYLSSSGLHWNKRVKGRQELTDEALEFVRLLMNAPIAKIALENPIGCISTKIRKPDQIIQPWQFGHDASKQTCLWLKGLPLLVPTDMVKKPKGERYANQTPSGQNKLGPSKDRWKIRSETYRGIADAMAKQWSPIINILEKTK